MNRTNIEGSGLAANGADGTARTRRLIACQWPHVVLAVVLVLGICSVEVGLRDPVAFGGDTRVGVRARPATSTGFLARLRAAPADAIGEGDRAAIVSGVVFGRTDGVDPGTKRLFLDSGLWHLLAASGQNVALVTALCVALSWLGGGGRALGCWLALVAVPLYVLVVGGGASIVRAGVMAELGLVAWLTGRMNQAWHAFVVAATAIVWTSPGAHRTLGFQLSFLCVAALLLRAEPWTRRLHDWRIPHPIAAGIAATTLCSIASAPVLLLRTGQAPLTAAVLNLVAVPIASLLLVVGLSASLVWTIAPTVAAPALWSCGLLAAVLVRCAEIAVRLPFAQVHRTDGIALAAMALASVVAWHRFPRCRGIVVWIGVVVVPIAVALNVAASTVPPPRSGRVRIAFLDVGQGEATLIQTRRHAVVVDPGPPSGVAVRELRRFGVHHVDGVVLTHRHADHAGGMSALVRVLPVAWSAVPAQGPRVTSVPGDAEVVQRSVCDGSVLTMDRVVITVVHPRCDHPSPGATGDPANDNAVVVEVALGQVRTLLTSDAEGPTLLAHALRTAALLQVPHHGSDDPRFAELLDRVRPRVAAISVGAANRYGHPDRAIVDELARRGIRVARTDREGTVTYESDGTSLWRIDTS